MKQWDGLRCKNDKLRAGDELWFHQENKLLSVRRSLNCMSNNLRWSDDDNKRFAPFVRNLGVFAELARMLADAANLECGKVQDVKGGWMVPLIPAKKQ